MIASRIRELRKYLNLTMDDFGKQLGVSKHVVANIEYGRLAKPKDLLLDHICEIYNVNKSWLLSGDGEMFDPQSMENKTVEEALKIFKSLTPEFQVYALKQMEVLLEAQNGKNSDGEKK